MDKKSGKTVKILSPVMEKNNRIAEENRKLLKKSGIFSINFISSPGAGKTSILESMAEYFGEKLIVIEGDVQTSRDAERIRKAGCEAYQIETGGSCHLDAQRIADALEHLNITEKTDCRILAIENVGNLICPSSYDLGEHMKIGILSLPEGDDKILKYPSLFSRVSVLLINKIDLLPHMQFDVKRAVLEGRSLKPDVKVFEISAKTGKGMEDFCSFLDNQLTT